MSSPDATQQASGQQVIQRPSDFDTIEALAQARAASASLPLTALFMDDSVAELFRDDPNTKAVAWGPVLAHMISTAFPPSPRQRVAPSPIVVGDGAWARLVVKAYVTDWADPGQPLTVHCLGTSADWVHDARDETAPRGDLTWSFVPLRPGSVAKRVAELVSAWPAPRQKHATVAGPAVVVALSDESLGAAIAAEVARQTPAARVAVVVSDLTIWPAVAGVRFISTTDAQRLALDDHDAPDDRLARLLLDDIEWLSAPDAEVTRPVVALFAKVLRDATGTARPLAEQPTDLQKQLSAVAGAVETIVAAGNARLSTLPSLSDAPVIFTPGELGGMASEILRVLGVKESPGARLTALELAFRLPAMVARTGRVVARPAGHRQLLTFETVELLAPLVHLAYQNVGSQTGNATGSPLAFEMWEQVTEFYRAGNRAAVVGCAVAHAAEGFDWRGSTSPRELALTVDQVERLAELEHRRWAIHQRRNGAGDHDWMKPWADVKDSVKQYDRHIARALPAILADASIEVYRPEGGTS